MKNSKQKFFLTTALMCSFHLVSASSLEKAEKIWFKDQMIVKPTFPKTGMFACCNLVLGHLHLFEKGYYRQMTVNFEEQGVYYDAAMGENWWSYFFKPIDLFNEKDNVKEVMVFDNYIKNCDISHFDRDLSDPSLGCGSEFFDGDLSDPSLNYDSDFFDSDLSDPSLNYSSDFFDSSLSESNLVNVQEKPSMSSNVANKRPRIQPDSEFNNIAAMVRMQLKRQDAAILVNKYIKIKDFILDKVESYKKENFDGHFIIGVHYRGTDKRTEAPRVTFDEAIDAISEQIALLPDDRYKIFVATDEGPFLNTMKHVFPGKIVHIEAHRSYDASSVHHSGSDPYEIGEEALVDTLLLSKCNILIRTSSNLSLWSTYFNPELPVIMLNKRYANDKGEESNL